MTPSHVAVTCQRENRSTKYLSEVQFLVGERHRHIPRSMNHGPIYSRVAHTPRKIADLQAHTRTLTHRKLVRSANFGEQPSINPALGLKQMGILACHVDA